MAYNGYHAFQGNASRIKSPQEIPAETLSKFRSVRPYIRSGEDYLYLFQALAEGITFATQMEFDKFHDTNLDRKESYYQFFYAEREALRITDHESWITLNPPYEGMIDFLQSINPEFILRIVSTKASRYILEILNYYGIKLDQAQIYQADRGSSKHEIISRLMQEHDLLSGDVVFVDDHLDTLQKVADTSVRCLLAGWGYNTDEQQVKCRDLNLEAVNLQQFYKVIKRG